MKKLKKKVYYVISFIFCVLFIIFTNIIITSLPAKGGFSENREQELDITIFAKITSIDSTEMSENGNKTIHFSAQTFGTSNSKTISGTQVILSESNTEPVVSKGNKVILVPLDDKYIFQCYYRLDKVIYLCCVMFLFIIIIGKLQGLKTIITLALTCLSIFYILIPAIKKGVNIYFCTIIICIYIIFQTFIIVYGINKKSLISCLGCCIGIVFSGVLCVVTNQIFKMTGYINDEIYMLNSLLGFKIDLKALLFSMITIGALGSVMDVSMSVTSPLYEYQMAHNSMTRKDMLHFGMSVGKDFIGTMTNTLVLAYIGSSMIVILMYSAYNYPLLSILNKEMIIFEFLQSIIGCIGILLTVPVTTIISSTLLCKKEKPTL